MLGRALKLAAIVAFILVVPATAQAVPNLPDPVPVCPPGAPQGVARCHAWRAQPQATSGPTGYNPADLQSAYNLVVAAASGGVGATVAIVDAYDNPNAAADLAVYRAQFCPLTCTGSFTKVNQNGAASPLPSPNSGWASEIALDIEMVSAICPQCNILLVEANSSSIADLGTAVNTAASTTGVVAISNSYGTSGEFSSEATYEASYYNHPGIAVTVSAGDSGYGTSFPAVSRYVTSVGGTSLRASSTARGWTETVWNGTGSGCSKYIGKPSWQSDGGCSKRTVGDVAAVADPSTGVSVYDSYGSGGWVVFGGTSVSSPIIAAVYALAGNATAINAGYSYSHSGSFYDVTSGNNGRCWNRPKDQSKLGYLCTGVSGYDGPTGLGTPNGTGGF